MDWKNYKEKEKIFAGEYGKTPDGFLFIEGYEERYYKKSFNHLVKKISEIKECSNYEITPLTNEDNEYVGCFLSSITINEVKISAIDRHEPNDEFPEGWAELELNVVTEELKK